MKQPLVSFVIPVLNGEQDIARCLNAIRSQSFASDQYEVLIVDNGSTDRTQQIVRDLGFHVDVIPGVTVSALRNQAAKSARGAYVALLMQTWSWRPIGCSMGWQASRTKQSLRVEVLDVYRSGQLGCSEHGECIWRVGALKPS